MTIKKEFDDIIGVSEKIDNNLLQNHTRFLTGDIDVDNVTDIIKWIIFENMVNLAKNTTKELTLYINSPGGSLDDAFALIDIMRTSIIPIKTVGIGRVSSAAFLIFASATKGRRFIARNTTSMCHQFSTEIDGKHHDIKAQYKELEYANQRMIDILKEATGLQSKTIKSKLLSPTDIWLTAEELVQYGVADVIF